MMRRLIVRIAVSIVATGAAVNALAAPKVVSDRTIPALLRAADVRWLDDDDVIVADVMRGVGRVSASHDASITWLEEWPQAKSPGLCYYHLALSRDAVIASDFVFQMRWRARQAGARIQQMIFEYVADVDLDGDRLLLTGLHRDEHGKLGTDGAIACLGSLSGGADTLRAVLPFHSMRAIVACAGSGLGTVRFLHDGSFIVVPGAESGIYHFSRDGRVDRVWQTSELGIDVNCALSPEEENVLHTKPLAKEQWVNRRPVVDEVVDTPAGPAVIVRKVNDGRTEWEMLLLNGTSPRVEKLPFTSPSPWAHLTAAGRGARTAFLIGDRLPDRDDGAPTRLVIVEWAGP